jgi:hypothetical protein
MKYFPVLLLALLLFGTLTAQEFETESAKLDVIDAPTIGSGAAEIEFGYRFSHDHERPVSGIEQRSTTGIAGLGLTYGIAGNLDLNVTLCWCDHQRYETELRSGTGLGDGSIGVKWMVFEDGEAEWTASLHSSLQFPMGLSAGVGGLLPGSDAWSLSPGAVATLVRGRISASVNTTLLLPIEQTEESIMHMYALGAGIQLTPHIQPVVELAFGSEGWFNRSGLSVSAGAIFNLAAYVRLTAGLLDHRPLREAGRHRCGYLRMTVSI